MRLRLVASRGASGDRARHNLDAFDLIVGAGSLVGGGLRDLALLRPLGVGLGRFSACVGG